MYEQAAVPAWAIFDSRHRAKYFWGTAFPGRTPQELFDNGYMKRADTMEDIASACGIDPDGLARTVERFNRICRQRRRRRFPAWREHIQSLLRRSYGQPNPNLGTVAKAPFYAVAIYPGDIGTCGGIVADEHARALRADGSPIPGFYVTGNTSAAAGGRVYLGAGAAVGPSMVFGYVAARHAAGANA